MLACRSILPVDHFSSAMPLATVQVSEWLTFSLTELNPLLDDKLTKLNDWLLTRTFLVGNTTTLADLVIYAAVAPAAVSAMHAGVEGSHHT